MRPIARIPALLGLALVVAAAVAPPAAAGTEPGSSGIAIVSERIDDDGTITLEVTAPAEPSGADFAAAFEVRENGEPVEVVAEPMPPVPLVVALVIDTSGSIAGPPLDAARAAALQFQDVVGSDVPVGIVTAGQPTTVLAAPTTDRSVTAAAIESLTASGETSLNDSLIVASSVLGPVTDGERHAVVLLTDGADTASLADLPMVTDALKASGIELVAIALDTPDQDLAALETIVASVDGQLEVAPDEASLAARYNSAAERLTNRWLLSFATSSEFARSSIEVTLTTDAVRSSASTNLAIGEPVTPPSERVAPREPAVYVAGHPAGFQNSAIAPWGAAAAVVTALGLLVWAIAPRTRPERRLAVEGGVTAPPADALTGLRHRAGAIGSALVERAGYTSRLDHLLDEAGIDLSPGEAVAASAGAALLAATAGAALGGLTGAAIAVVCCALVAAAVPSQARARRRRRFADQLADTLTLLAGSLRAGNGIGGAIDAVAAEVPAPMSDELARATLEARLGRSLTVALDAVAERMRSRDFTWVVEAIDVQREVGGNLAQIFDRVSNTIRARQRLRRQIQAATAEGRLSALVLICMPIGVAGILMTSNPEYMQPLFTETTGQLILGAAVALLTTGGVMLKRLVEPDL